MTVLSQGCHQHDGHRIDVRFLPLYDIRIYREEEDLLDEPKWTATDDNGNLVHNKAPIVLLFESCKEDALSCTWKLYELN